MDVQDNRDNPTADPLVDLATVATDPLLSHFVHIITLGIDGSLFRPLDKILTTLGIPQMASTKLLQRLHVHAVQSAYNIVRLRRGLERVRSQLRPQHPPEPP
jgi:hypothetical protein